MEVQKIEFNKTVYTAEVLSKMKVEQLLEVRNLLADNLGLGKIRNFKSHNAACAGVWHGLQEYERSTKDENYKPILCGADGNAKAAKLDRSGGMPKCDMAEFVKRPTKRMFFRIKKTGTPDKSQRPEVWDRYTNGMRVIDTIEASGIHSGKITWWAKQGLMELVDPGDDVTEKELKEWYEKQGRDYPGDAKNKAKEEIQKAKAEKAIERQKAKEEKAKAAAEKKAASESAKAEKAKLKAEKTKVPGAPGRPKKKKATVAE